MAHIVRTVRTAWSPELAFAYMADFSHAAEWDPGVAAARREDDGEVALGSVFELMIRVGGRRFPLRYEVTHFAPPQVTFTARSFALESVDTVTVTDRGGETEVRYDARIHLRGLLRIADPLLALGFRGVADRAIAGLERRLSEAA
ncbi:MAG TPA: SRPBCC family protein [Acidimicrobiales bacterium]|nr:SRPBCC family protein [Acidimicrobiales bacterium]